MNSQNLERMTDLLKKRQRDGQTSLETTEKDELISLLIMRLSDSNSTDSTINDDRFVGGVDTRRNEPG